MKKLTCLICFLALSAAERESFSAQLLIVGGGGYNQLQMTNALGTGDAYYAGTGYMVGARIRLKIPLTISGANSSLDFWGSYQSYQTANTADTSEINVLTPISLGIQTRHKVIPLPRSYLLVGFDYEMMNSSITSASTAYLKTYGALGLSLGLEIAFTSWLSLQAIGTQHLGLAPGTADNSGSRGVSELTGSVFLQLRLLQLGNDK